MGLLSEYTRNPHLALLVAGFVAVYIAWSTRAYKRNAAQHVADRPALPGEYSHASNYTNISAMKHDMFKQMTIDLLPTLIIFGLPSLLYWLSAGTKASFVPIIKLSEVFSLDSYQALMQSMLGRTMLTVLGYFIYYQVVQPSVVNSMAFF